MGAVCNLPGLLANTLAANDDLSTGPVALPFALNFFSVVYNTAWVNNNGNATLGVTTGGTLVSGGPLRTYTPFGIQTSIIPIVGVYFADVDSRPPSKNLVTYGTDTLPDGRPVFGINYLGLGYYGSGGPHLDKTISCQLLFINDFSVTGDAGDFSIQMNFDHVGWEAGDASGGVRGLGGTSAAIGFSNGSQVPGTYVEFPGSRVPGSFLDANFQNGLVRNSGSPDGVLGRYLFPVRAGVPVVPILPGGGGKGPGGVLTFPTGTLKGHVTPYAAPGASVSLAGGVGSTLTSSPSGAYEMDLIPIGLYSALVAECGYYPQSIPVTVTPDPDGSSPTVQDVTLVALSTADAGSGFAVGWVADLASGQTLPGAAVTLTLGAGAFSTTTDAGGAFSLLLPPGTYALSVSCAGYADYAWPAPVVVASPCATLLGTIGLPGPPTGDASILGYVEDAITYTALAGAAVSLIESPAYQTTSAADGAYGLDFVPSGSLLTVYAARAGYRARRSQVVPVSGQSVRLDLGLVPLGVAVGSVSGFVTDAATGLPLPGAAVRVAGVAQAVANARGYYVLADLPVGGVAVQCVLEGYAPQQAAVTIASGANAAHNFALAGWTGTASCFYGQVRDAVSGVGLPGAAVSVDAVTGTAGPRGAYLLVFPVPPKTHIVKASNAGYYPLELDGLPVAASQSVEMDLGLVSTLTPVGAIHGYVADARHTDTRLGGALVSLGRFLQTLATFPDGAYLLPFVPSGVTYQGAASVTGYAPRAVRGVRVGQGKTLELDFFLTALSDMAALATLTVTVTEAGSGRVLPGALVQSGAFGVPDMTTGADGKAVLSLPPGTYTVAASLTNYRAGSVVAVVAPGSNTAPISLRGFPDGYSGGQVYGHVTSALLPPGQGVGGCLVTEAALAALTDAQGFYVLDHVPVGTVSVLFDDPDYAPKTVPGVVVMTRQATRCDAVLAPWSGALGPGWRVAYSVAQSLSRPPLATVTSLAETPALEGLRQADSLFLVAQADTPALGRFRRVRLGVRTPTPTQAQTLKTAVALPPGVQIQDMPGVQAIPVPPPMPSKT